MEAPESDDLQQLMPNLQQRARQAASPANTAALREYIKVLGENRGNVPAASTVPHKPRTDGLQLRGGTGRCPQRRYFTIKWRPEDVDAEQRQLQEQEEQAALEPEALKDAMVEQARTQRRALMQAALRPGTGRAPRPREFAITLPPPPAEQPEEEEQLLLQEAEEQLAWQAEGGQGQQYWEEGQPLPEEREAEAGVLAEHKGRSMLQPALRPADASEAATPGAGLLQQQDGLMQSDPRSQQQQQTSQHGQALTPGSSLIGRYTPMEGVPERLVLLATRGKHAPATASRFGLAGTAAAAAAARTPAGFTPLEGIPERLNAFQALPGGPRPLGLPGATRIASNGEEHQSVDSPVEGLVQQGAWQRSIGTAGRAPQPLEAAAAVADFAGFSPLPQQEAVDEGAGAEDMGGDIGGYEAHEGIDDEPSSARRGSGGSFPFLAAGSPSARMADAGVQTGASLAAEEEAAAAVAAEQAMDDYDDDCGFDAGGDYGYDEQEPSPYEEQAEMHADLPETSAAAQQRAVRKQTKNPGSRLRNELKRKSLAADPRVGRHEILPGVRRSSRAKQEPLRWWLNEKKEFGREHKTMPTVHNVVHKVPNTPWQMVSDIRRRPAKKLRAPTPHDLEVEMAAAEEEQQWEEEETAAAEEVEEEVEAQEQEAAAAEEAEEEQQEQQQRQSGRRQKAPAAQQRQGGRRQGKQAKQAPAAKGKATKKKAAAGSKRGRGRG